MDCREFEEQITPAVDQYLEKRVLESFREHATKCPHCRFEFETELVTKSVVHDRLKLVATPLALTASIALRLERSERFVSALLRRPYVKPALAFALTCVAIILLVKSPSPPANVTTASVGSSDVILQSLANYRALVRGTIKPQMECVEPEDLKSFFSGKTEFPVLVPVMKECTLVGGVLNEYDGVKLAHVLYRRDAQLVYMYQTCLKTVMQGEKLNLPDKVRRELEQTGWYMENFPDGNSIVIWTKGETLCSAVAHMPKQDLFACLTSDDVPGGSAW